MTANKKLIYGILVVVILIIVGIGLFFFIKQNTVIRCGGGPCKCMKEKECEPYGGIYIIPTGEGECSANLDNKMCCCPGV
ncbi:hypothetical protein KKG15_01580 [Patescibacteria group bacterium]|nr:hypothetical protein [Patescibacteria group bacterium]